MSGINFGTSDVLPYPPSRIGGKNDNLGDGRTHRRPHQIDVSLLKKVCEIRPPRVKRGSREKPTRNPFVSTPLTAAMTPQVGTIQIIEVRNKHAIASRK
jgi:hypothetical protein